MEAMPRGAMLRIWQQLHLWMHASSNAMWRMSVISLLLPKTSVLAIIAALVTAVSVEVAATKRWERIVKRDQGSHTADIRCWTILSIAVVVITGAIAMEATPRGATLRIWQQLHRWMHASSNAMWKMNVISLLSPITSVLAITAMLVIAVSVQVAATERWERIVELSS